jgi:hypothetical protein
VRFNNRCCALLDIPDLPTGAFEHIGDRKIKPQGGGGSWNPVEIAKDTVSSTVDFVQDPVGTITDTLDKADNWTEAVGEDLAKIDPGPALGDIGEQIDKNVIQPMAKDPVGSIATIAAIASQQYYLLPVIAGANTAIKGGRLEDIALAAGIAYAGSQFAPGINEWAGGGLTGAVTTGAALGAGGAGSSAAIRGQDVGEAILRGGVVGGVMGGVGYGVSQGYNTIRSELGYGAGTPPPVQADAEFVAAQAESLRNQPGGVSEQYMADILRQEGVNSFVAQDVAGLTSQGIGEKAVAQNIAGSYQPGEIYTPPPVRDNIIEKTGKKLVTEAIGGSILDGIFGTQQQPEDPYGYLTFRRRGKQFGDTLLGGETDSNVNLTQVVPDKFELRKYANPEGQSTLISFKDDQPQQPIPTGYEEVETIGAAEGGLISTNMVKYSKKPLLAKRKPDVEKKVTARKGLAGKKS